MYKRFLFSAFWALGEIGDPEAFDDLTSIVKNEYIKKDKKLKEYADSALRKIQEV